MDLYSHRTIGLAKQDTLAGELTQAALHMTLARNAPIAAPLFHSDRDSQYVSTEYLALLTAHQCVPCMCRRRNCYDNVPVESFFNTLKIELIHQWHYHSRAEVQQGILSTLEGFYHTHRRHSASIYRSPTEFEQVKRLCLNQLSI